MNSAERVQIELLRQMSPAEKLELVRQLTLAVQRLGPVMMKKVYGWEPD